MALNWPGSSTSLSYAGVYIDVVATEDDTDVVITSPVEIMLTGSTFSGVSPNVATTFNLDQGELLHLVSFVEGEDISGMEIVSPEDKPVAVFAGTRCSVSGNNCCCDHIEQQLLPLDTWGTTYFASKFNPRGTEVDYYRIISSQDDNELTINPPQDGHSVVTLDRGETLHFGTREDFKVSAQAPILMGQFMVSSNDPGVTETVYAPIPIKH